jgi:hypothetical protein
VLIKCATQGTVNSNNLADSIKMVCMTRFEAIIKKFEEKGEKSGWTYIDILSEVAMKIKPGNKKSFRVKGKLDDYKIKAVALVPMGGGDFIMALNGEMRKKIGKRKGEIIKVVLEEDSDLLQPSAALLECLSDEPKAMQFFENLTYGHKNYFTNWIESAKTEPTKTKRIAQAVDALNKQLDFGTMLRSLKGKV